MLKFINRTHSCDTFSSDDLRKFFESCKLRLLKSRIKPAGLHHIYFGQLCVFYLPRSLFRFELFLNRTLRGKEQNKELARFEFLYSHAVIQKSLNKLHPLLNWLFCILFLKVSRQWRHQKERKLPPEDRSQLVKLSVRSSDLPLVILSDHAVAQIRFVLADQTHSFILSLG